MENTYVLEDQYKKVKNVDVSSSEELKLLSSQKIKNLKYNFKTGLPYYNNYFLLTTLIIANIIL